MNIYFIWFLRIVHIVAGMFWFGGAVMMAFIISPTIGATAEAGQKVAEHLMGKMQLNNRLAIAAGLSILAGFALYWNDSAGFTSAWMTSGAGKGFGIGAGFAIIGFIFGNIAGITTRAMAKLSAQFQGKPSSEQMAQMQALQKRQGMASKYTAYALIVSVIFMSIARYLVF